MLKKILVKSLLALIKKDLKTIDFELFIVNGIDVEKTREERNKLYDLSSLLEDYTELK